MPCYQSNNLPSGVTTTGRTGYTTEADCNQACGDGACCEGASCSVKPQCQCQGAGKTFKGVGTTCTPNPCSLCGCDDLSKASQVSFAVSFSGFTPTQRLGIDVNTSECSAQYGFNAANFVAFRVQGESQESFESRMSILNLWSSWLNSVTAILSFNAQASALAGRLVWKGQSQTQTPFGASAVIPFIASACGIGVSVSIDEGACLSNGPIVYPTPSTQFNLSSGACSGSNNTPTHTAFSTSFFSCALTSASGCAAFNAESQAYRNYFEGTCSIATRFNPLP
jgi:hypothetical protein